jgi:dihydrofolate reductase
VAGTARRATDDIATEVGRLRDQPGEGVVSIGGAALAAAAIAEDLIDEYRLFVINPVNLGGGTPYFTPLTEPLDLRLTESSTFTSCVVYLRYQRMR